MDEQEKKFREEEIREIERRLAEKRSAFEREEREGTFEEREALEEIVHEEMEGGEEPSPAIAPGAPQAPLAHPLENQDELEEIRALPEERRLHALIDVAFAKGVKDAIEMVRHMEDPYLIDAFHDALVDALYAELIKRGKLKM